MFFSENPPSFVGSYIPPITKLDARLNSQVKLLVWRNAFAAQDHPQQHVQLVVDQKLTTAKEGDFSISEPSLNFSHGIMTSIPVTVNIHGAKGKKIVLLLQYDYYDECPATLRKTDRLNIYIN